MPPTVVITDSDLGDLEWEATLLREDLGVEVVTGAAKTEAEVLDLIAGHDPVALLTQWAPITETVLDAAPGCRVISRYGIGVDMIDVAAARERGIEVLNVPYYCTEEVATHSVAMALALLRRLPQFDAAVRDGEWNAAGSVEKIRRLSGSTIGLIGGGRIGLLVAAAFAVWGARIVVHDPVSTGHGYEAVDLATLAAESDVISLHAPLLPATRHVVGTDFLAQTRRSPILVNTSRGGLVDLGALTSALEAGTIGGAGLDVFEEEPLSLDDPIRHAPNVLLAPHAAWCSDHALPELRRQAVMNVVDGLRRLSAV